MTLRKREILKVQRANTRSHCLENSLWKRLWTCRKTHYIMNAISTVASGHNGPQAKGTGSEVQDGALSPPWGVYI